MAGVSTFFFCVGLKTALELLSKNMTDDQGTKKNNLHPLQVETQLYTQSTDS